MDDLVNMRGRAEQWIAKFGPARAETIWRTRTGGVGAILVKKEEEEFLNETVQLPLAPDWITFMLAFHFFRRMSAQHPDFPIELRDERRGGEVLVELMRRCPRREVKLLADLQQLWDALLREAPERADTFIQRAETLLTLRFRVTKRSQLMGWQERMWEVVKG